MENLKGKFFITGEIKVITGMRIGGSSTTMDIGSVNNNVIKTIDGEPYIPGSSLKGKLRSLYALSKGCKTIEEESEDSKNVFGHPVDKTKDTTDADQILLTRLIVRDAYLIKKSIEQNGILENEYTEVKWENSINKTNSKATPRQMERVPKGAKFNFNFIYSIFDIEKDIDNLSIIIESMRLLEDDFLGGSGSRGYGQVEFSITSNELKTTKNYQNNEITKLDKKIDLHADNEELFEEIKVKLKNNGKS